MGIIGFADSLIEESHDASPDAHSIGMNAPGANAAPPIAAEFEIENRPDRVGGVRSLDPALPAL